MKKIHKYKIHQLLLFALATILQLSFIEKQRSYQTECVSIETDGYITLKIWDIKKSASYTPEQAQKDAIHSILFSGISGNKGCSTQAPLLKGAEEQAEFGKIEKTFFSKNGNWMKYTRSSAIETTLQASLAINNVKVYQVSVSKNELRKYMEDQKIIKSLNNGF